MNATLFLYLFVFFCSINDVFCDPLKPGPGVCTSRPKIKNKRPVTHYICCTNYMYQDGICKPQCKLGCDGGICVEPDKCQCREPLVLNADRNKCVEPVCDPPCLNGWCKDTNLCVCTPQYTAFNKSICAPVCETGFKTNAEFDTCIPTCNKECVNGTCTDPEVCTCDDGYELSERDIFTCVPACNPKCVNGYCSSPNTCVCDDGYTHELGTCSPKCESCEKGECQGPNSCKCNPGYERLNNTCVPHCHPPCKNGFCEAPDKCSCDQGYRSDEAVNNNCIPDCNPKCINAVCEAPDSCICDNGYIETGEKWYCRAECSDCFNGSCLRPNVCVCNDGFEMAVGGCTPVCKSACANGYCSSPDVCICNYGFKLENESCVPAELIECKSCEGKCSEDEKPDCFCSDRKPCYVEVKQPEEMQSPKMAGLEMTWVVGGSVGLLLLLLVMVVIERLWRKRRSNHTKTNDDNHHYGSVVYTVPDTLSKSRDLYIDPPDDERGQIEDKLHITNDNEKNIIQETRTPLLTNKTYVE